MIYLDKNSEQKIYKVLTNIVGLSNTNSRFICNKFGFQRNCTLKNLDILDFEQLRNYLLNNFSLEKLLVENISQNVKKKIDLGIYQGKRHNLGYPVRGQRTLSNGKTQKRLHKFRYHYDSELFTHSFFKNQRKSKNSKKLARIKKKKEEKLKIQQDQIYKRKIILENRQKKREKEEKLAYDKKLQKIQEERRRHSRFRAIKAQEEARKNHPYFVNIRKANERKAQRKAQKESKKK
jgi:small subunit ribosomal protein S13